MREKEFQAQVVQLARLRGWLCYHTHDSRRSEKGFPDLVMIRVRLLPGGEAAAGRCLVAELKTDRGTLTAEQGRWIEAFRAAGIDARVWRPSMWEEIERILE